MTLFEPPTGYERRTDPRFPGPVLWECPLCGALVTFWGAEVHDEWHRSQVDA